MRINLKMDNPSASLALGILGAVSFYHTYLCTLTFPLNTIGKKYYTYPDGFEEHGHI